MKRFFFIFLLSIFSVATFSQSNPMEGKVFRGIISEACKSFKDGGCMISTYHTLSFEQDSVKVNYFVDADCDVPQRNSVYEGIGRVGTYPYQVQKKLNSANYIIRIDGYEIANFEAFPDKLVEFINDPKYPDDSKKVFEQLVTTN